MIPLNEKLVRKFLAENKIENCEIKQVAGDASFRSYYRIFFNDATLILMFAPPSHEDLKPFIEVDEFLISHNFLSPFACVLKIAADGVLIVLIFSLKV